jgi:type IV secretion system protein TrbE
MLGILGGGKKRTHSRISRSGMPNGFFFPDGLLWYGDAGSKKTAVSRGFIVEPLELDNLDAGAKIDVSERLCGLIASLGTEYTMQVKYLVCSDYSDALERYRRETEKIASPWRYRWQIWNRTERYQRYKEAMEAGRLRREILTVYFSRVVDTAPGFELSEGALAKHFEALGKREALAFAEINGAELQAKFPDCRVRAMSTEEQFLAYYRFLNPNIGAAIPNWVLGGYDESRSIQENCLLGDLHQGLNPGVSFDLDSLHHGIVVMRELPKTLGPGLITRLTNLGFVDYDLTLNIYPQRSDRVVKALEDSTNQLAGEMRTKPKEAYRLGTQLEMGAEQIREYERGSKTPIDVFMALRLWCKDPETLISRISGVTNAFTSVGRATCYHATNPETARQLFYQTWPGWTYGTYRGYDQPTDNITAADLVPWSCSFTGRLDTAEALYDSATGGLVGVSTEVARVPQHMVLFAATRGGKSTFLQDLMGQTGHLFGYVLIVDDKLSHATSVETLGGKPIIITPNGNVTINPYDTGGLPLSREHLGGVVGLCLLMLREAGPLADPARVSRVESNLTRHITQLYTRHWDEWRRQEPEREQEIARRALAVQRYLETRMKGYNNTFLDAWRDFADWEQNGWGEAQEFLASLDEEEVAKFATHHATRDLVRDVGISDFGPEDFPTHGKLVEMMTMVPIGGEEENPEAVDIGERLETWSRRGPYGKVFDGVSTVRVDGDITYFEVGMIPEALEELRAAAYYLVLNVSRQAVLKRPRGERKFCLFEEGARLIQAPGGAKVLREYYTQMGKFGATVCTVFQQYAALKEVEQVRSSVFDNTKLFFVSAQPSSAAAEEIGNGLSLSESATRSIRNFVMPEHQTNEPKHSSFLMHAPGERTPLVGALRNIVSPEMLWCAKSDNEVFDERKALLAEYEDVVEGILTESRNGKAKAKQPWVANRNQS